MRSFLSLHIIQTAIINKVLHGLRHSLSDGVEAKYVSKTVSLVLIIAYPSAMARADHRKLRRSLCIGYGNRLAEKMLHHNGYHTIGYRSQLVQVHPSSVLEEDEAGQLPDYVVYHELINTSRPFMRNVCAVEMAWVSPILKKLEKLDIDRLSGGSSSMTKSQVPLSDAGTPKGEMDATKPDVDSKIQTARERYLARKGGKK